MQNIIAESKNYKILKSPEYNYIFDYRNGNFMRWGKTKDDDPQYSSFGPEIMDIEISTICKKACKWCYKSNTAKGTYMTFSTFVKIFEKFPKTLTQIAFGIGDITGNPDLWAIMEYCRNNKVIPNVTINGEGITDEIARRLVRYCGAIAVSNYDDKCYDVVKKLTDLGHTQINIHALLCQETYDKCFKLIDDSVNEPRLKKLNAMVFLWLKPKGKRNHFHAINSLSKYKKLVDYAFKKKARIGFDSCSANAFLKTIKDRPDYKQLEMMVEPCESSLFSVYCNVDGEFFPCSFAEECTGWKKGLKLKKDFLKDIWNNERLISFRKQNIGNCRKCVLYDLEPKC